MAQEDQEQEVQQENLTDEEETDLRLAVNMAEALIDEGGYEVIQKALESSNDPGVVIGQFLMQLASSLEEQLPPGVEISKRIFFAQYGWIEQVSDFLQEEYEVPTEVMDRAEMYIGTAATQMQQNASQQQAATQQPQAAPAPQGGLEQQMGGMA